MVINHYIICRPHCSQATSTFVQIFYQSNDLYIPFPITGNPEHDYRYDADSTEVCALIFELNSAKCFFLKPSFYISPKYINSPSK